MEYLRQLRAAVKAKLDQRAALEGELDTILAAPTAEARDLNEAETARFAEVRESLVAIDREVSDLEARIGELEAEERARQARSRQAQELGVTLASAEERAGSAVRVTREESTYRADDAARGVSFLRDAVAAQLGDFEAVQRLARHSAEHRVEQRDGTTANYSGLVVPQYLTDLVAEVRRAGRPFADICTSHDLPAVGNTLNISRITTGSTVGVQTAENAALSEQDIDDTLLTVDVRTVGGIQDVARQVIDRGVGTEGIILRDLARAYNTTLDNQLINGSGSSGQVLGVRSTTGIVAVTYTDTSPTPGELWPKLHDLIQQVQAAVFMGVSHFIMHPRRWAWFSAVVGTSFPFVQQIQTADPFGGSVATREYGGVVGRLAGVPVVLDANIPTNLGAGTNEDVILGVTADELHLWEDSGSPLMLRVEQVGAHTLTARFVLFGYVAFTAGRYPSAHGTISGTGLITPTF